MYIKCNSNSIRGRNEVNMRQIKRNIVERLIAETGLSAHAWAIQHGFAPQTVNAWIHGVRNIGGRNLVRLADALRVSPDEICSVVFRVDDGEIAALAAEREELVGLFGQLSSEQRGRVLRLVRSLADANRAEEELIHGIDYTRKED